MGFIENLQDTYVFRYTVHKIYWREMEQYKYSLDRQIMGQIYKMFISPVLEYASENRDGS